VKLCYRRFVESVIVAGALVLPAACSGAGSTIPSSAGLATNAAPAAYATTRVASSDEIAAAQRCVGVQRKDFSPAFSAMRPVIRLATVSADTSTLCSISDVYTSGEAIEISGDARGAAAALGLTIPSGEWGGLAIVRGPDGTMNGLVSDAAGSTLDERVREWATALSIRPADAPALGAWQPLARWEMDFAPTLKGHDITPLNGSKIETRVSNSFYRLNTIDPRFDYWLVWTSYSTSPSATVPSFAPFIRVNWKELRMGFDSFTGGVARLFDHGPTGTVGSTSETREINFQVGGSLSDKVTGNASIGAKFGVSQSLPDVSITDQTGGAATTQFAQWLTDFGSNAGAARSTFTNQFSTVSIMPKTLYDLPTDRQAVRFSTKAWLGAAIVIHPVYSIQWDGSKESSVMISAPYFAITTKELDLAPDQQATFNIIAAPPKTAIPQDPLAWTVTNTVATWLAVNPVQGSGSTGTGTKGGAPPITVTAQHNAPIGNVAYIQVNTNPVFAADEVQSANLAVRVCIVAKRGDKCPIPADRR
jgi:hypothetical protein